MYERMLNKQSMPSIADMTSYCGESGILFTSLNEWLSSTYATLQELTFPYGKNYGWAIAHRKKKKLMCHVFAENNAFSVMLRLSNEEFASIYDELLPYTQDYVDHKYPCSEGGWIHYRVTTQEHLDDIKKLLTLKCG